MGKGYIDKRMGGRFRDKDASTGNALPADPAELRQYIQNMFDQSTIDFSQITGSPTTNLALKNYIDSTLDLFLQNNYQSGTVITQAMIDYFNSLLANINITWNQITGSPAVNQEFIDYLTSLINELSTKIATLVVNNLYTSIIKSYIDQRISSIKTMLETLIQNTVNNDLRKYIDQIINLKGESTRLIPPHSVIWIQNLDFLVSPLKYQILNQYVESAETQLTIPANASADPMFALIIGDVFGNISYVLGVPAPAPAFPLINSSTQILITPVYIPGLSNTPGVDPNGATDEIVTTVIYDENTEWATAKTEEAGVTIDLADLTNPAHGTKAIKIAMVGGASLATRSQLLENRVSGTSIARVFNPTAAGTQFSCPVSQIFPDNKTDNTVDGVRHLVYYRLASKQSAVASLFNEDTGAEYPLIINSFSGEGFNIPSIGFSAGITSSITFSSEVNVPAGFYTINLTGITRYDQQYTVVTSAVLRPSLANISFTALAPVACKNGNISLSLLPSVALAENSGLLFELYNGVNKVGSLAMITGKMYGFNPAVTVYQRISLPISDFAPISDQITGLVIRPLNDWTTVNLFIDNIILQVGVQKAAEIDKYVESVTLAEVANQLILTLKRTGGLLALTAIFGTMAGKTFWTGTQAAYEAIAVKDANTIYMTEVV